MLVACDPNGGRKVASNSLRGGCYTCPECGQEVTVRVGEKRVPHFAHKTGQGCKAGRAKVLRKRNNSLHRALLKAQHLKELGQDMLFELEDLEMVE